MILCGFTGVEQEIKVCNTARCRMCDRKLMNDVCDKWKIKMDAKSEMVSRNKINAHQKIL